LFVALSIAMAARGRIGWGPTYMDQDRYHIYGLLVLALLYLLLLDLVPETRQRLAGSAAVFAAALFSLLSYASYLPGVTTHRRWTEATLMDHQLGRDFFKTTPDLWEEASRNWHTVTSRGLVLPPAMLSRGDLAFIAALDSAPPAAATTFSAEASDALCGYGLTASPGARIAPPEFAVILDEGRPLVLPVDVLRSPIWEIPRRLSFYGDRFQIILPQLLYRRGAHPLYGLRHGPGGNLAVQWRGAIVLP
jgi:hypothetical protein